MLKLCIIVTAHYGEKGSAVIPALGEPLRVKFNGKKLNNAGVAELADALDSGSSESNFIWVQVPSPAPITKGALCAPFVIGKAYNRDLKGSGGE